VKAFCFFAYGVGGLPVVLVFCLRLVACGALWFGFF
jgi:hypothetical protein